MKTGIVFKIEGHKAIILQADGSFVAIHAKPGWAVGQTVVMSAAARRMRPILAAAACFAMILLGGFGWRWISTTPVAWISLDVNPSIELCMNRFARIISATALNIEGERILAQIPVKNLAYTQALANILRAEETGDYFTADADLVVTVFAADAQVQADLLASLQTVVHTETAYASSQMQTEYYAVDENTLHGAHTHGMTAGRYMYLQALQALAPETDVAAFSHHSISEIKEEIARCEQEHLTDDADKPAHEAHHASSHHGE